MVEVFKTNVQQTALARDLVDLLSWHFPGSRVNFDLEDCDNVLRVEGDNIRPDRIASILVSQGCICEALD